MTVQLIYVYINMRKKRKESVNKKKSPVDDICLACFFCFFVILKLMLNFFFIEIL